MKSTVRLALTAPDFPFLYRDAQRAVIDPRGDVNRVGPGTKESMDWNTPQLLFCENVMPISRGFISTQMAAAIGAAGGTTAFDQAIIVRDRKENTTLVVPAKGENWIYDAFAASWKQTLPFNFIHKLITRAYTQGRSFIMYEKSKLLEYDGDTTELIDRTAELVLPSGFDISEIRGIGGASNYLLLFTDIEILWSSPTDPLNFDRSLNNGSGFQTPQDVRGAISCILPVSGGAIIYTLRNAVSLTYTNNAAAPFVFRGISNSGGVASYEQVAYDADERYQYVWGSGGLQRINLQSADSVFAEVSDFLTSSWYEEYDYVNHKVVGRSAGGSLSTKLTYVSQRFLVVSYGLTAGAYSYALIFDSALQRWGKVKVEHVDAVTFPYPNVSGDLTYAQLSMSYAGLGSTTYAELGVAVVSVSPPKNSIAFLKADGTVEILVIDYRVRSAQGVAVMGQIQHNRRKRTTLHGAELEGVDSSTAPKLFALSSDNGKDVSRVTEFICYEQSELYRRHLGRVVGKNHQLALEGAFQLTGLLVQVAQHGNA